ncbi:MAG: DEAD/DEAH box helicase [Caldilineaceae bacterium]
MALDQLLTDLRRDPDFMMNVMAWRTLPATPACYASFPAQLHPALQTVLQQRQIAQLYTHQAQAVQAAFAQENVVVVTPTASGKTLCYNLPVLDTLLRDPHARALYLFPTKALAHDQLHELVHWESSINNSQFPSGNSQLQISVATYDGDTPAGARATIRKASRLILSNPDMLHMGILPYHTQWEPFFANLRYVVLDELHSYRGIFGSHVANVLRRLQRICRFYGSAPQFICTSATIANPQQLAERLIEQPVTVISENGAPRGEKQIILYNPPLYDAEQGLRRSSVLETQEFATRCLRANLQTIVFGRSRLTTEVLLTYLRERMIGGQDDKMTGRQDDRMPWLEEPTNSSRITQHAIRAIAAVTYPRNGAKLKQGCVMDRCGAWWRPMRWSWASTLADYRPRCSVAIRAVLQGRGSRWGGPDEPRKAQLAILVATGGLLDQYVIQHPDYIFERSPEHALINPDNLRLLVDHLRCAAFELPFQSNEAFGNCPLPPMRCN